MIKLSNRRKTAAFLSIFCVTIIIIIWVYKHEIGNFEKVIYFYLITWSAYNIYKLTRKYVFPDNTLKEIGYYLSVNFIKGLLYLSASVCLLYIVISLHKIIFEKTYDINFHYLFFSVIGLTTSLVFEKKVLKNCPNLIC